MRPIDIYNSKVLSVGDFNNVESHLNNDISTFSLDYDKLFSADKIKTKTHFFHSFDYRRYLSLQSVWFEDVPVMIIQEAGREGDDHTDEFITNFEKYTDMINFIRSCYYKSPDSHMVYDGEEEIPELTNFYGYDISNDIVPQ